MTPFGQGTPLHPHRSQEHQAALFEVPLCQGPLDPLLTLQEPGAVEGVLVQLRIEDLAQGADRCGLGQPLCRGQLRGGLEDACRDHGQDLIALMRGLRVDQPVETDLLQGSQHCGHMPMGKGADDVEGVVEMSDCGSSLEEDAQSLDESGGPLGEVGDGALLDLSVFAIGLAEQDGAARAVL